MAELPDGFVVNDTGSAAPPPGFQLDNASPEKPGLVAKALEPITSYPETYRQMNREAREQMATGAGQVFGDTTTGGTVEKTLGKTAAGAGNMALGALGYVSSPISAGLRTIVGKPIEENTGIPKEYSEFAASLALPGVGLRSAMPTVPSIPRTAPLTKAQEIAAAADRLGIQVPKAVATESIPLQATAGALKEVPVVGTPLVKASKNAAEQIENAVDTTAQSYGAASLPTAGQAAKSGIENWITSTSRNIADRIYGSVDQHINPTVATDLNNTRKTAATIVAKNMQATLPEGKAVGMVMDALNVPGGLPYEGIKTLRTRIGELAEGGILPEGMSKGELKQIYGGLTKDLQAAALNAGGPDGLAAFNRANSLYDRIASRREALTKIIGVNADAPPETVMARLISMASGKSSADISRLTQARRAMGAENWDQVAAATINKMGRTAEDATFSGARFVTSWNNLSERGRELLFNSTGNDKGAQSVKDLVTLSNAHKKLLDYGNPSGTGRTVTISGLAAGMWAEPISTLGAAVSGNIFARVMASPVQSKQAVHWARAYVNAAKNPSAVSQTVLANSSANLSSVLSSKYGLDPMPLFRQLTGQGTVPVPAQEQPQQ